MSFLFKKEKLEFLGTLYDINENQYNLYMSSKRISKSMLLAYQKLGVSGWNQLILKRENSVIDPEYAARLKFDFTKTDDSLNKIFLNKFLVFPSNIQILCETSILTMDMIRYIWGTKYLMSEFTKNIILQNQDIFSDWEFINSLEQELQWIVFTQNKHRTQAKLSRYKGVMENLLEMFFIVYLGEDFKQDERVYNEWYDLLIKTLNDYFPKLDIEKIKERAIISINEKIDDVKLKLFDNNLTQRALENFLCNNEKEQNRKVHILKNLGKEQSFIEEEIKKLQDQITRIQSYM